MTEDDLRESVEEWVGLFAPFGAQRELAEAVRAEVLRRYAEPARHYHTMDHVGFMLDRLLVLSGLGLRLAYPLPFPVVMAAWLHDVIYDPRAKDNEERSAEYAQEVLASLGVDRATRDEVARLILLTKTHETTAEDVVGQCLLDADLSVLSASEAEYDAYAAAIRREYHWVSDDDYRTGRRQVLQRFLARPRIYYTERMFEQCESKARANLAREIASLGG